MNDIKNSIIIIGFVSKNNGMVKIPTDCNLKVHQLFQNIRFNYATQLELLKWIKSNPCRHFPKELVLDPKNILDLRSFFNAWGLKDEAPWRFYEPLDLPLILSISMELTYSPIKQLYYSVYLDILNHIFGFPSSSCKKDVVYDDFASRGRSHAADCIFESFIP